MGAGHPVLLNQKAELPPGLDQRVVDGLVLVLPRPQPASIRLLLFQDLQRSRQVPQALHRPNLLPQQVPPGEVDQSLIAAGQQRRDRVVVEKVSKKFFTV